MKKNNGYWSLEMCKQEALKYNSKSSWQKSHDTSYRKALKKQWLIECCKHMNSKYTKPKKYWTLENCKKSALKFDTRSEWQFKNSSAYGSALKNNWLDICCAHMKLVGNYKKRLIYAFEFENKSVYVGLTHDFNERLLRHLNDKRSSVYNSIKLLKLKYVYKKLTDYINIEDAQKKEKDEILNYKEMGWCILNKIKGGGIGGNIKKWTKQNCINEALKYNYKSEWEKNNLTSYSAALKRKWIDECSKHMIPLRKPNNYWTFDICKNDAQQFRSKKEWREKNNKAYSAAKRNNFLKEIEKIWQKVKVT